MKQTKKVLKKIVGLFAVGAVTLASVSPANVTVSYADAKSEAESRKAALEQDQAELQQKLNELDSMKNDTKKYIEEIDAQSTKITKKIYDLKQKCEEKQKEIETTTAELTQAQESLQQQYQDMSLRIQYMYENGNKNYLNLLLSAESFSDLLNKAEYVSTITKYDNDMFTEMENTKNSIETAKTKLESDYAKLTDMKATQEEKQKDLNVVLKKKKKDLTALNKKSSSANSELVSVSSQIEAEKANIEYIEKLEKERAKKEAEEASKKAAEAAAQAAAAQAAAAQNSAGDSQDVSSGTTDIATADTSSSGTSTAAGSFVWPLPSSYHTISCKFGTVDAFGKSGHCGTDYPAPAGTPIYAAGSGTVEAAGFSAGMGNYVIVYHGNGLSSIYMHASALLCKTGDKVSAGQTIALVGTTGPSTGNHLHISFRLNGSYVSPHTYIGY